jgi:hypothetical protein
MTRAVLCAVVAAVGVSLGVSSALAQSCEPELVRAGQGIQRQVGPATHYYASGGVLIRCIGQATTLRSDSLAWYSDRDRLDFVGRVRFEDDTVTLTARQVRYFPTDERLEALGEVRLVNKLSGSVLRGPNLTYWRAVTGVRDTSEMLATQRPTVEYRSSSDTTALPYIIVADRVRLRGESQAFGAGRVEITREDFVAAGDSATLDFARGDGMLVGHAVAQSQDSAGYRMQGRRIAYRLVDDELRWVQARGIAEATSNDWRVVGDTIEFDVAHDLVQGGRVWGDSTPARALSDLHTVDGDSLAIDAPDHELREVRSYGDGRATARRDVGSAEVDWVAGDTVLAQFEPRADGDGRMVRRLEARGAARAYYHVYDAADADRPPAIAYSRGRQIAVLFENDELERVDVVDQADGVYLEPQQVRRP